MWEGATRCSLDEEGQKEGEKVPDVFLYPGDDLHSVMAVTQIQVRRVVRSPVINWHCSMYERYIGYTGTLYQ